MGTENTISKGENIKIQVGDKVRIVKNWVGYIDYYNSTIGLIGVVHEVMPDGCVFVKLDKRKLPYIYESDAVELIKDEED